MFNKKVRITVLLLVLFVVATDSWLKRVRSTDWQTPLWVVIYPINGDGSETTSEYIRALDVTHFNAVEDFFSHEAERHELNIEKPLIIKLAPEVHELPPQPPHNGSMFDVVLWSLKLRYWSWQVDTFNGPGNAQLFVIYHDPEKKQRLAHSTGLREGMVGIVNAFATTEMAAQNHVILAHEFLHMVGASDKYDMGSNQPQFPDGFAEPGLSPLLPQNYAELMGGRIPISHNEAVIPESLNVVLIGEKTAREINWRVTP